MDQLDQLSEFVAGLPAWVIQKGNKAGMPLSWQHFHYGLAYLRRKNARDLLDMAGAARIGASEMKEYRAWRDTVRMTAYNETPFE